MKDSINIIIEDLDNLPSVLKSIELLFSKLIMYYGEKDLHKLNTLVLSISVYFGKLLTLLGYDEEDLKGL